MFGRESINFGVPVVSIKSFVAATLKDDLIDVLVTPYQ
jgi:hypothetical protein